MSARRRVGWLRRALAVVMSQLLVGGMALALLLAGGIATAQNNAAKQDNTEQESSEAAKRQYNAAAALQKNKVYDLAIDEWQKFLADFPDDPRAAHGRYYLGYCLLTDGQFDKALATFDQLLADYPKFPLLETAGLYRGLALYNLAQAGQPERYAEAAAAFAELAQKNPQSKSAPQALYYQGEALYAAGQKAEAAAVYAELATKHPDSDRAADGLYALGVARQELGMNEEAGEAYVAFLKQFPKHALAAEVGMRRGQVLYALGQFTEAEKLFAAAATQKDFEHADFALLQQARCQSSRKQYGPAAALFASLPEKFPKSPYVTDANLEGGKCAYLAGDYPACRAALGRVLSVPDATADSMGEAAHWIVRGWLKEGNPAEGLKVAEAALPKVTSGPFAAQLAMDQADCLYELPDRRGETPPLYAAIADKFPDDAQAPQAQYMAGFAALGQADYPAARKYADAFLRKHAGHPLEPDVRFIAAESRLLDGQPDAAEPIYATIVEQFPQHAEAPLWRVRRGVALAQQQKHAEAAAALEAAVETIRDPALLADARYRLGAAQIELQQYEAAARSLATSLEADPTGPHADEATLALALAYRQLNDLDQARGTLAGLIANSPDSPTMDRAHYRLGECAYMQGDYATAATEYRSVLDKFPASTLAAYARHGLGWTQLGLKEYAAAVQSLTELLDKHADSPLVGRARFGRALARQQLQEYSPAIEDLEVFLKTDPPPADKSTARYALGLCLAGLGRHAEAAAAFEALLADDPNYSGADKVYYELAWARKEQGQNAEAAQAFAALAKKFGDSPLAAECLFQVGEFQYAEASEQQQAGEIEGAKARFQEAAATCQAAAAKAGNSELGERIVHKLAWAQYRLDDFAAAQASFARQRKDWPGGTLAADAAFMEGECLFKQGQYAEALAAYKNVSNPTGKDFAALTALHAGQAAAHLKKWSESLALLENFPERFVDSDYLPEALFALGQARENLDQTDEALKLYEEVTAKTDREVAAQARFMIGEIYFARKDHKEAVRNFFKAAYGYGYPKWQAASHYEAARCFEVLGKVDQAVSSYKEVVEKHPNSDKAKSAAERLTALGG
jgi:TolA-binding protein